MQLVIKLQKQSNGSKGYFLFHILPKDFKKSSLKIDKHYFLRFMEVGANKYCGGGTFKLQQKIIGKKFPYNFFYISYKLFTKLQLREDSYYIINIKGIKGFGRPKKLEQTKLNLVLYSQKNKKELRKKAKEILSKHGIYIKA